MSVRFHSVVTVLTESSVDYVPTRDAIYRIAEPLVERARQAGEVRRDVDADDVMRLIFALPAGSTGTTSALAVRGRTGAKDHVRHE